MIAFQIGNAEHQFFFLLLQYGGLPFKAHWDFLEL